MLSPVGSNSGQGNIQNNVLPVLVMIIGIQYAIKADYISVWCRVDLFLVSTFILFYFKFKLTMVYDNKHLCAKHLVKSM